MRPNAILPQYQSAQAAGFDFHAAIDADMVLVAGGTCTVATGVAVEIPAGYELQVRSRSGLAFNHDVTTINGVGTIDADFRGEIMVKLINRGATDFVITPDMRIAQGVVARHETVEWEEVDELGATERGAKGFGSTGVQNA